MMNINLTAERHIQSLNNNGARIKAPDGTTEPVSMDFYRRAVEACVKGGYNAVTYELELPGIDGDFQIAFWRGRPCGQRFHPPHLRLPRIALTRRDRRPQRGLTASLWSFSLRDTGAVQRLPAPLTGCVYAPDPGRKIWRFFYT